MRSTTWTTFALLVALAASACNEAEVSERWSRSLGGTETDGVLRTDADGRLIVDHQTRWLYDYFLTAEGELGPETIRAQVVAEAYERLDPQEAQRAVEVFDAYVAFREEAAEVGRDDDVTLDEAAARLHDAYARHLGGEAAFAGELERIDEAVAVARVLSDDELDPEAKSERLAGILEEPEQTHALAPARAHRAVREARAQGAGDDEVFAIRAEYLGEEAARRLAALDEERQVWRARVAAYRREARRLRDAIAGDGARAEAIEALRAEHFSGDEILRIRALDGVAIE
jgi:lipase chaperone LimK